jgi:hypothetical protein
MGRRVFFSFNYAEDAWRAGQVRNCQVVAGDDEWRGFVDAADWESIRRGSDQAVENWIDRQMKGTSVTVVLIGENTHSRRWVRYEIARSIDERKGLLGIRIHKLKNHSKETARFGQNPFDRFEFPHLSETWSDWWNGTAPRPLVYDWLEHNGRDNINEWIATAAEQARR